MAKKSLGQNFLTSEKIVGDIIDASNLEKRDLVLEVGPGKGMLTKALLKAVRHVVAIEKDRELIPFLEEKFSKEIAEERLTLIEGDVMLLHLPNVIHRDFKVVANIPYYITGGLFRMFLESEHQPQSITFLVQKEVAHRIVARDNKESILSMSVKAYGTPKYVEKVPARYFKPAPQVDSAILFVKNISKNNFANVNEENYFEFVKTGFAHKRKLLINNLEALYPKAVLQNKFKSCSVPLDSRAENLTLQNWLCLAENVSE
jgi:16S rRNA (adenine1518-N6/adenine1519-N6)-dimethyltransferase